METDNRIKVIYIKNALPSHEIDYLPQFALNSNFNCTCLRSRQYEQPIYISLPKHWYFTQTWIKCYILHGFHEVFDNNIEATKNKFSRRQHSNYKFNTDIANKFNSYFNQIVYKLVSKMKPAKKCPTRIIWELINDSFFTYPTVPFQQKLKNLLITTLLTQEKVREFTISQ